MRHPLSLCLLLLLLVLPAVTRAEPAPVPALMLGAATAPVRMVEYASLTCSHCARFHAAVLPELERDYITPGKLRVDLHLFPLDGLSLRATALTGCVPQAARANFIKLIFATQAQWARLGLDGARDFLVRQAGFVGGNPTRLRACWDDRPLLDRIVAEREQMRRANQIESTPTFLFPATGQRLSGAQPAADFRAIIDPLLAPIPSPETKD